jgi:ectoine hydroxylase-related dioxygenase (phytanoyl-CoA dioxygenase family)
MFKLPPAAGLSIVTANLHPMAESNPSTAPAITQDERHAFDNTGYLVLEKFLPADHVARLVVALERAAERRREAVRTGAPQTGFTHVHGRSTRFFYILDEDPLFLELLDWPALMPYVHGLLNPKPHHHGSDGIIDFGSDFPDRKGGWHLDGHDEGYRGLGWPIPHLQLKIGYYLSDMTSPGHGNLAVVPGSHKARNPPTNEEMSPREKLLGMVEVCAPAGTAILFHNALWHTSAPFASPAHGRKMLYYAYEHPWMVASQEHWSYSKEFYNRRLSPAQRKLFHGFVFDPPEQRWG